MAFHGRVALITGAASGIGRLAAQRLADGGAQVAALDVNADGLRELARERPSIHPWTVDVSDARGVEMAVKEVEAGLGPIDRVFTAAAIMPTGFLLERDIDEIRRIMEVNYFGTVYVVHATLPGMLARGRGDLILSASLAGWVPTLHFGAYDASKSAVVAFSEVLYHENRGRGVRIACVCAPVVQTPLLEQATSRPKMLANAPKIRPEVVLDATERGLEAGRFWIFPHYHAKVGWRMRRFIPGLFWRIVHRVEEGGEEGGRW